MRLGLSDSCNLLIAVIVDDNGDNDSIQSHYCDILDLSVLWKTRV